MHAEYFLVPLFSKLPPPGTQNGFFKMQLFIKSCILKFYNLYTYYFELHLCTGLYYLRT